MVDGKYPLQEQFQRRIRFLFARQPTLEAENFLVYPNHFEGIVQAKLKGVRLLIESIESSSKSQTSKERLGAFLAFVPLVSTAAMERLLKGIDRQQPKRDRLVMIER
jgi:hypothetical protein